jgi:hypothetical protein
VDEDSSGILDKGEVALLLPKIKKKFRGVEFDPPFDLDRDFELMDADGEGEIDFEECDVGRARERGGRSGGGNSLGDPLTHLHFFILCETLLAVTCRLCLSAASPR